ncbi:29888_t:CDS:2, partial [Racocetra persica]
NVRKRLGSEWDEIMIEERDIRQMNKEIILYDEGPVAGEVEDNQRKQLLELLKENPDICAQDISELGRTDIIQH